MNATTVHGNSTDVIWAAVWMQPTYKFAQILFWHLQSSHNNNCQHLIVEVLCFVKCKSVWESQRSA